MTSPRRGQTALVTGASSGIGRALARQLAARGCDLVLTARREDRLRALREEIGSQVRVDVVTADLAAPDGAAALVAAVAALGRDVDLLFNNAGIGAAGAFAARGWEDHRRLLQLNVLSVVELTRRLLPPMLQRGRGHVVFVGSVVSFMPVPLLANYAASKAYVRSFAEALWVELQGSGVGVTLVAPGSTATEFFTTAGYEGITASGIVGPPDAVAAATLGAMTRGARVVVPGRGNAIAAWAGRVFPTSLVLKVAERIQLRRLPGARGRD